jgi:hypothetical protein
MTPPVFSGRLACSFIAICRLPGLNSGVPLPVDPKLSGGVAGIYSGASPRTRRTAARKAAALMFG